MQLGALDPHRTGCVGTSVFSFVHHWRGVPAGSLQRLQLLHHLDLTYAHICFDECRGYDVCSYVHFTHHCERILVLSDRHRTADELHLFGHGNQRFTTTTTAAAAQHHYNINISFLSESLQAQSSAGLYAKGWVDIYGSGSAGEQLAVFFVPFWQYGRAFNTILQHTQFRFVSRLLLGSLSCLCVHLQW